MRGCDAPVPKLSVPKLERGTKQGGGGRARMAGVGGQETHRGGTQGRPAVWRYSCRLRRAAALEQRWKIRDEGREGMDPREGRAAAART